MHHPRGVFSHYNPQRLNQDGDGDGDGAEEKKVEEIVVKINPSQPIIFGPPTPEGPAAGAATPINADCPPVDHDKLPPKKILKNETTWAVNKILKFTGDINWYKNSTPAGYDEDIDYDKKDTFKSTKDEKKKDMIEIKKEAKKLAKESEHKNVDMDEIEKVEKREEKKGVKWECNITGVAQLPGEAIDLRLMEVAHKEENERRLRFLQEAQDPNFYANQYLAQQNYRHHHIPSVHSSIYAQKPSVYDHESKPYYNGEQTTQEKIDEDRAYPPL